MSYIPKPWPPNKFSYPDGLPSNLVLQSDPDYAFRETRLWNCEMREKTTRWLEDMRKGSAQRQVLYRFTPDRLAY